MKSTTGARAAKATSKPIRFESFSKKRRAEGAPSRKRKSAWDVKEIVGFYLEGPGEVARALREGWLTNRDQVGRRNSNDAIRRAKYGAVVEEIPAWARL